MPSGRARAAAGAAVLALLAGCQQTGASADPDAAPAVAVAPSGGAEDGGAGPEAPEASADTPAEAAAEPKPDWFNDSPIETARRLARLGAVMPSEAPPPAAAPAAPAPQAPEAAGAEGAEAAAPPPAPAAKRPPAATPGFPRVISARMEESTTPLLPDSAPKAAPTAPSAPIGAGTVGIETASAPPPAAPADAAAPQEEPETAPPAPAKPAAAPVLAAGDRAGTAEVLAAAAAADRSAEKPSPFPELPEGVKLFEPRLAYTPGMTSHVALKEGPGEGESWADVGVRLIAGRDYAPALQAFGRAALEDGMTRRNALGAVAALRGLGRIRQALTMLEAGIGRWPESALMRNNYGVLLHEQGRLVEAERELRVAARILDRGASDAGHVAAALRAEVGRNLSLIAVAMEMEEERTGRPLRPPLAEPDGGLKLLKDEGAR